MRLFGKNKELNELKHKLNQIESNVNDNKYYIEKLKSQIKKLYLISSIFPNEQLYNWSDDYKKDKERLEKEGYTMQGCIDSTEIWVNKGVKNG